MFGDGAFGGSTFAGLAETIDLTKFNIRIRPHARAGRYSPEVLERSRTIRRVPACLDRVPEEITPHQSRYVRPTQQWYWMIDHIVKRTRMRRPAPRYGGIIAPSGYPQRLDEADTRPWRGSETDTFGPRVQDSDSNPSRKDSSSETSGKRVEDADTYTRRVE